jgi:O-antigen/teichoic acid export membrane protein
MIKRLRTKLTADETFQQVLSHSFWAFVFLGISISLQFLFDFLLARQFGANGSGIFYLAFSLLTLFAMIGRIGFDRSVIRFLPPLFMKNQLAQSRGLFKKMLYITGGLSLILCVFLLAFAERLSSDLFNDSTLSSYLYITALTIPALALLQLGAGSLRALKQIRASLITERILVYGGGTIAVILAGSSLNTVFWGFLGACYVAAVFGLYHVSMRLQGTSKSVPFSASVLMRSALPLFIVSLATLMFGQITTILLGALSDTESVGVFGVAFKISMLMNIVLVGINSIGATTLSELHGGGKELKNLAQKIAGLSFLLSLPLFFVVILFPEFALGLFGEEFKSGSTALILLMLGQLVNTGVGSANHILSVTGHEKELAYIIGGSVALSIVSSYIFIPAYNIEGAALAVALSIAISNALQLTMIRIKLGFWSLPFGYARRWLSSILSR